MTGDISPMNVRDEWRAMLSIAGPVVVVQVGLMFMGVVDTLMVGHLSANALAAVAIGNLYVYNVLVIAMGALQALDPLVAQAVGAGDTLSVRRSIQRGLVLCVGFGVVMMLGMAPAEWVLRAFHQPEAIVPSAARYVNVSAAGVLPLLAFIVLRQSLQAIGRLAPIVVTIIAANALNVALNWVLIFGHLGMPALGVTGSAIATAISRLALFLLLLVLSWPQLRPHLLPIDPTTLTARPLLRMLALGLPIGFQQFLEISAFGAVGLLTGSFGELQVAAYQVALNLAALTFMVPLGVAAAASVRVGHAIGAGDIARARLAARIAYTLGFAFMCTTAVLFLTMPNALAGLYTRDSALIAAAGVLIPIGGVFQIFDGMQAVGAGVLRGLGDTRVPVAAMLSGYWLIGVPVSVILAFKSGLGVRGLWYGFVAGLASVALFLLLRVLVLMRRGVSRTRVD